MRLHWKAKPYVVEDRGIDRMMIDTPAKFTRKHCDMHAARTSRRYGSYANSDLFEGMLQRGAAKVTGGRRSFFIDDLPAGMTVDTSGFLAKCSIDLEVPHA